jgi:hypothetical protein
MTVNFVFLFLESGAVLGLEFCVAKQSSKLPKGTASSLAVVFFRMALAA